MGSCCGSHGGKGRKKDSNPSCNEDEKNKSSAWVWIALLIVAILIISLLI